MTIIEFAVAILIFAMTLVLILLLRLNSRIIALERWLSKDESIGTVVTYFEGIRNFDGSTVNSLDLEGQTTVIVLLSSGCTKCASKRDELLAMLPGMIKVGVVFYIVPADPVHGVLEIVGDTELSEYVLHIDTEAVRRLNPSTLIPSYLFIDEHRIVRDQSHMDDENWKNFLSRMIAS